ncbi:MAG: ubiquitin-like domain-containing protein, partial [Tepidiforma sp.]
MTQALPRPYLPSRLRHERRQFVRRARARIFRGRNHAAAVLAVAAITVLGVVAFPSRDTLVVSESGARLYHTVFPGELAALPGLAQPAQRTRVFETAGLSGIGIQASRSVTITVDGRDLALVTTASTVGGALAEAGVALGPRDRVRLNGVVASPAAPLAGFRIADGSAAAAQSPAPVVTVERARR